MIINKTPAKCMFKRNIKTRLNFLRPHINVKYRLEVRNRDTIFKKVQRVYIKNCKNPSKIKWIRRIIFIKR